MHAPHPLMRSALHVCLPLLPILAMPAVAPLFLVRCYCCVLVIAVSCPVLSRSFSIRSLFLLLEKGNGRGACGACSLSHWLRSVVPLMTLYTQRGENVKMKVNLPARPCWIRVLAPLP